MGIGQALEQQGINERKDGGIGADGQGQSKDNSHGKAGVATQLARGELQILHKNAHEFLLSNVVSRFEGAICGPKMNFNKRNGLCWLRGWMEAGVGDFVFVCGDRCAGMDSLLAEVAPSLWDSSYMGGIVYLTLKRGANDRCAYGAGNDGQPLALWRMCHQCSGARAVTCH
jgi:hypothetical protein